MHFMDSIFIFGLALILFGPKKLPEIGRQIGKIVLEFRKASNEFKMQIEDELRASEQAERQEKLAAETAALTAGVLPVLAAVETSTPSALTIQPPTTGEQVSTDSPYMMGEPYRTGAERLAAVIVESPGEDPHPDAIAEIYPASDPAHATFLPSPPAEDTHPIKSEFVAVNSELVPINSDFVPAPPDRHTSEQLPERLEGHVQEADQAPTHHG